MNCCSHRENYPLLYLYYNKRNLTQDRRATWLFFDPISIDSIQAAIVTAIKNELPCAMKLIENDLSKIMQLLVD